MLDIMWKTAISVDEISNFVAVSLSLKRSLYPDIHCCMVL